MQLKSSSTRLKAKRLHAPATREEWLERLVDGLRPHFASAGAPLPDRLRISCGWPTSPGEIRHVRALGTTWSGADDGVLQIFISPKLIDLDGPVSVGGTVVHECTHAAAGLDCRHRGEFKRVAEAIGLLAPMPATTASQRLQSLLTELCEPLGPYPHSRLEGPTRRDSTRMLKLICRTCGYAVRTTQRWIDCGLPFCPDGDVLERVTA